MKSIKRYGAFFSVILLCILLVSCSHGQKTSSDEKTGLTEATNGNTVTTIGDDKTVNLVNGNDIRALNIESSSQCSISFVESNNSSKREIKVKDGGRIILKDSSGNDWILEVPPYALTQNTVIELVALNDIKSSEWQVPFAGGVKMLPDGLKFLVPATMHLHVNSTAATKDESTVEAFQPVPLLGKNDGSVMELVTFEEEKSNTETSNASKDNYSIAINHFSTLVFTDRGSLRTSTSIGEIEKKVIDTAQRDLKFVRDYLKSHKDSIEVPIPPSVSIECEDENTQAKQAEAFKKFLEDAFEPEGLLLRMLAKDLGGIQFLGLETPLAKDIAFNITSLINRLEKKALKLMDTYRGQPQYLLPVCNFAINVAKNADSSNFLDEQTVPASEKIMSLLGPWVNSSLDPILKLLREEHDYRQANVAIKVASWAALLGVDGSLNILEELKAAMQFELIMTAKYTTADTTYQVDAKVPLKMEIFSPKTGNFLNGTGSTAFTLTTSVPDTAMTAVGVPVHVLVTEFDPCLGMGKFTLDNFFVEKEVMTIDGESIPMALSRRWWEFAFGAYASGGGEQLEFMSADKLYTFPFTINNRNAILAEESIDGQNNSKGKMTITFEYKIEHLPNAY